MAIFVTMATSYSAPALNRAYDLEKTVAKYPRIVFDNDTFFNSRKETNVLIADEDCLFLDPFSIKSIELSNKMGPIEEEFWDRVGLPKFADELEMSGYNILPNCLHSVKTIVRSPLKDEEYEKVAWLFDRIA